MTTTQPADPTLIPEAKIEVPVGRYTRVYHDAYLSAITGKVEHKEPTYGIIKAGGGIWASQLRTYLDMLAALGIDDPLGVADRLARYDQLRGEAIAIHRAGRDGIPHGADIAAHLADGTLNAAEVPAMIPTGASPADARKAVKVVQRAADEVLTAAAHDMWTFGDQFLTLLRPTHDYLIAHPSGPAAADHWRTLHKTVRHLRDELKVIPSAVGATALEYRFANVLAAHCWYLDHARRGIHLAAVDLHQTPPRLYRTPIEPEPLTLPTIAEHVEDWQPGIYSAAEVVTAATNVDPSKLKHGAPLLRRL
jgi:hypothetical protein